MLTALEYSEEKKNNSLGTFIKCSCQFKAGVGWRMWAKEIFSLLPDWNQ